MSNPLVLIKLLALDVVKLIRWWKTHTLGKIIVTTLFLTVFGLIAIFIYISAFTFLFPLTQFEVYGQLTAAYLTQASLVIAIWLGIASAFVASLSFLTTGDYESDYLITLPIKPIVLVLRYFIRSLFASLVWSLIVFLPLGLIIGRLFSLNDGQNLPLSLFAVVAIVVIFSSVLGSLLSFIVGEFIRVVRSSLVFSVLTLIFIFMTLFLIQVLLPRELGRLQSASPEEFLAIFMNLPLNRMSLPTLTLTKILFGESIQTVFGIIGGLFIFSLVSFYYQSKRYLKIRHRLIIHKLPIGIKGQPSRFLIDPLTSLSYKDIISVWRSSSEMGYVMFLLILLAGFFYFLSRSIIVTSLSGQRQLLIYSFYWFFFYAIAYLLRVIFPLMAKEGRFSWFIFTKPTTSGHILNQKILASVFLSLPLYILSFMVWFLVSSKETFFLAGIFSFFVTLLFSVICQFAGNFFPNFRDGHNPEKVSTSTMGVTTLAVLLLLTYFFIKNFQFFLMGMANQLPLLFFMGLLSVIGLWFLSRFSIRRYQF